MINKNIEEITKNNLHALISNEIPESKTIEYKQALPGNSESDKKEFLADVTSFANASGGDLIYGIEQDTETGFPKPITGFTVTNIDEEKTRLENLIRTGVQPRLPSVSIKEVSFENSKYVIVIRIQKSWISPHRVILGGHDKFYSRNSSGKYPLDVGELRIAFNLSETITDRIRNFKTDRLTKIIAGETPVPLYDNPKIVLHLIPVISFNQSQSYDIGKVASRPILMPTISFPNWKNRYNIDGFITYSGEESGKSRSYTQLFRNGILEAVEGYGLRARDGRKYIYSNYEKYLVEALNIYLVLFQSLSIETPILAFLTLTSVKGYTMYLSPERYDINEINPIDRDILQLPEVIIDNYEAKAEYILKPSFDSIWNACGFKRSFNYSENGEWAPLL